MPRPNRQVLRQGSQSRIELKEKILHIYDTFFQGKDPTRDNANFWEEFFLLKANVSYIEKELDKLTPEGLLGLKENINALFYHCAMTLEESYPIRVVNALQTLCALIRGVYQKAMVDHGFDVINILIGFDSAEQVMQMLIERLNNILTGDQSVSLKNLALKVLLVISTVANNVSQNTLLEYLMMNSVFESIVQILANPVARCEHGYEALLLLTMLVNYRKYESANAYIVKLSILDDELALNGLGHVISTILGDFNGRYKAKQEEEKGSGWLSSITSMVGNMFVSDESDTNGAYVRDPNNATLLALYEAVHLNRNFITVLSHNHADPTSSAPSTPTSPQAPAVPSVVNNLQSPPTGGGGGGPTTGGSTNILVTFLSYCSIIMQDLKDDERFSNTKLCLIILSCIAEDQYANSFLHDANLTFRVPLHQAPMRHRKQSQDLPARPLACALLDLTVEFISSHMMRNLPQELYLKCLGVIHRILCYQKKCRVRLQYSWISIWTALISLLKYILASESVLLPSNNVFELACKVVNLFNLFITYGDTFLPSANCYDQLYYELIRMHQVFDNIYNMARRHITNNGEFKDSANKLANNIVNIRAIINHFTPKIDSWAASQTTALTEEQVLTIVKNNYDTLTLKLQDSLDQFERYAEKPKESAFFTQLVRSVVVNFRINAGVGNLEQQSVLQEFSTIQ